MAAARCQGSYVYSDEVVHVVSGLDGRNGDGRILSDGENAKIHVISSLMSEAWWTVFHAEKTVALFWQDIETDKSVQYSIAIVTSLECYSIRHTLCAINRYQPNAGILGTQ